MISKQPGIYLADAAKTYPIALDIRMRILGIGLFAALSQDMVINPSPPQ